jgi:hypothetical protein
MVIDIRRDYRSDNEIQAEIKTTQDEKDRMMQEFLAKGGKVEKLEPGIAIGASSMNYSGKLQYNAAEVKAQAQEQDKANKE